jgi:hypothetical protein
VLRRHRLEEQPTPCCTEDEGRPLGVGVQAQTPNRRKLHRSRASVVNVAGKGGGVLRQVRFKETNVSEPLMTCRNVSRRRQNRDLGFYPANEVEGIPVYCSAGVRHEGGVTLNQASVRNVGTCRPDEKGEAQADRLRKGKSTDAGHRGGDTRSRNEGPIMGLDRRGVVVSPFPCGQPARG